ncbi:MAG: GTPase domain-containing protein [Planctomycetes bacterium]|nr:GTPase domain-containing protein [Planctomycetota bacterium]
MNDSITLSLISHTNVGKTTLARTLLRKDIGIVKDDTHVTDMSEVHIMFEASGGSVLRLWDTPGFGDSAKLLHHLKNIPKPTGWFQNEVWDRFDDRAQWCNQQAIRNVREDADVVLYLVNAAEDPAQAGYVECEMQILDWLSKPVVVLLNQMGPPREAEIEAGEERSWEDHLKRFEVVKYVMSLDAFARCWVQEDLLMKTIEGVLPFAKRKPFAEVWKEWRINNLSVFERATDSLSRQISTACCDRESVRSKSMWKQVQSKLPVSGTFTEYRKEKEVAMKRLSERLRNNSRLSLSELIHLHQLEGNAATDISKRMSSDFSSNKPISEGVSAIIGGFITGAIGGVSADLLSGGLTFGGGAVAGGILGAAGIGGLARGFNFIRGDNDAFIRWSLPLFQELFRTSLLRYLAVAHFGRGRGEYSESEYPEFWKASVRQIVRDHNNEIQALWDAGKRESRAIKLDSRTKDIVSKMTRQLLEGFYAEVNAFGSAFK